MVQSYPINKEYTGYWGKTPKNIQKGGSIMFKRAKAKKISILCSTLTASCAVILAVVLSVTGCQSLPSEDVFGKSTLPPASSAATSEGGTSINTVYTVPDDTTAGSPNTTNTADSTKGPENETTSQRVTETTGIPQTLPPQTVVITVPVTTSPETTGPAVTVFIPETTATPETKGPVTTETMSPETTNIPANTDPPVNTDIPGTTDTPETIDPAVTTEPVETTGPSTQPAGRPVVYQYPVAYSDRVGDEWFSDAVFVGDSRTQGLQYWSDIQTATYYGSQGLNVVTANTNTFIYENGQNLTIAQALARHPEFKKIYVCLGVNEFWMAEETYRYNYTVFIDSIMAANPTAAIYMYAVAPVVDGLQHSANGLNNTKMSRFNQIAKEIAISRGIYYVDADAPFTKIDASGQYRPFLDWSESSDGIHLNGYGLSKLTEYLRTHTK